MKVYAEHQVGIFYSTGTATTRKIAQSIKDKFGDSADTPYPIKAVHPTDLKDYDAIIFGAPSYLWEKHRVSALDFDTIEPPFDNNKDLVGKKVAIFGPGDQKEYPKNFCDAIGILWEHFQLRGADMVGYTDPEGYSFKRSRALKQGRFCGLALDPHNQEDDIDSKISMWVEQLKREFEL